MSERKHISFKIPFTVEAKDYDEALERANLIAGATMLEKLRGCRQFDYRSHPPISLQEGAL